MRTLVTGANGFTGRALIDFLKTKQGLEIFRHARKNEKSEGDILCHDLKDLVQTEDLINSCKPERIYHLAGTFSNDFKTDYENNVLTSANILQSLAKLKVKCRVLLIGSAAEYGSILSDQNPVKETHPMAPVSIYGLTKTMQTNLMGYYYRKFNLQVVMARTFNLIGYGMSERLFFGALEKKINSFLSGESEFIELGNLNAKRDYLNVHEAVKYYYKVLEKGNAGEAYNVAAGFSVPIMDILNKELEQHKIDFKYVKYQKREVFGKEDIDDIYADISKLLSLH